MAKLTLADPSNSNEIDPTTGLEYTHRKSGKYVPVPTEANYIAGGLGQMQLETPMQNLALGLPNRSKYDAELSAGQLEFAATDPAALDEYRSEHQSAGRAALFALGKGLLKTGINVLGGTVGAAYSIAAAAENNSFSKLYDNDIVNELDSWSRGLDAAMPVYKSRGYESDNLLENIYKNPVMFMDAATDAISFTAGAVLTGYLTGGVASYFRLANSINKLNKATRFGAGVMKGAGIEQTAGRLATLGKIDDVIGNARKIATGSMYEASVESNNLAKEMRAKGVEAIDKELEAKYSSLMQLAAAEDAKPALPQMIMTPEGLQAVPRESKVDALKRQYDAERSDRLLKLEDYVQQAGNANYIANLAILSTSNALQFSPTFGMRWSGARKIVPKGAADFVEGTAAREGVEGVVDKTLKGTVKEATKFQKGLGTARNILEKPATEGLFEEGLQGASSKTSEDYYLRKYDPKNFGEAEGILSSVAKGLAETYGTNQGWKEIGMGMLIGGIGAPGKGLLPGALGIDQQTGKRGDFWNGGIVGSFKDAAKKKEAIQRVVDRYNNDAANTTIHMKAGVNSVVTDMTAKRNSESAINTNDKKAFLDAKDDSYFGFVAAREAAGVGETIDTEIEFMEQMTPDAFIKTYSGDVSEATSMTAEQKKDHQAKVIQELKDKTAKIRESISLVNSIEPSDPINNYDPDIEDYKEQLSYLLSKGEMIDLRQTQLKDLIDKESNGILDGRSAEQLTKDNWIVGVDRESLQRLNAKKKKIETLQSELQTKEDELSAQRNDVKSDVESRQKELSKIQYDKQELLDELAATEKSIQKAKDKIASLLYKKKGNDKKETRVKDYELSQEEKDSITEAQKEVDAALELEYEILYDYEQSEKEASDKVSKIEATISGLNKGISEAQERQESAEKSHKEYSDKVTKSLDEYKKSYKEELNKRHELSKDRAHKRNVEFDFSNFEDYSKEIERLYAESEAFAERAKQFYKAKPMNKEKLSTYLTDMERLENSRQEAIELLEFFKTKNGRNKAILNARKARYKLFEAIAIAKEELKIKAEELAKEWQPGKKYKVVSNTTDKDGNLTESEAIYTATMINTGEEVLPGYVNEELGYFLVEHLERAFLNGRIISMEALTEEDAVKEDAKATAETVGRIDTVTGLYMLTGKIATVTSEDGVEEYLIVNRHTEDGKPYKKWYVINEDDTVGPETLNDSEIPENFDLAEATTERAFAGRLVSYEENGKKMYAMKVLVSPFLDPETAETRLNYPTKVKFTPLHSKGEFATITDAAEIKAIVDTAKQTPPSFKKGKKELPVVLYNDVKGTIEYSLFTKKEYKKTYKGKDGKKKTFKKTFYNRIGEFTIDNARALALAEGVTPEQIEAAIAEGNLNNSMFKGMTTQGHTLHSFDLGKDKYDLIQETFISKSDEEYVIVRDNTSGQFYAVKKQPRYYKIYEDGQIGLSWKPAKDLKKITEVVSTEELLQAEQKPALPDRSIIVTAQHPTLFFTAGLDVMYTQETNSNGNKYFVDKRNTDNSLVFNPDSDAQRWYNFLRQPRTKKEVEDFKSKHKLRVVVNKGDWSKYNFSTGTEFTTATRNYDAAEIRVVLVDNDGNDVLVDGKPLFTTIHLKEFESFDAESKARLEHELKEFANFRDTLTTHLRTQMEAGVEYPDVFLNIDNVTAGIAATEKATEVEDKKVRTRKPVFGRIVPEGTDAAEISWDIFTANTEGNPIPATVVINGVTYKLTGTTKTLGKPVAAILGANGEAIAVPLLSRYVNEKEATTIAMLLGKVFTNPEATIGEERVIPAKDAKGADFVNTYLNRFIKYGSNRFNKDTQIFYDHKSKLIRYGKNNSISEEEFESKVDELISWLQATKIHSSSVRLKSSKISKTEYSVTHVNRDGVDSVEEFSSYNDYLFNGEEPVLTTDLVEQDAIQVVSPAIEFSSELYTRKQYIGSDKPDAKKSTDTLKIVSGTVPTITELKSKDLSKYDDIELLASLLPEVINSKKAFGLKDSEIVKHINIFIKNNITKEGKIDADSSSDGAPFIDSLAAIIQYPEYQYFIKYLIEAGLVAEDSSSQPNPVAKDFEPSAPIGLFTDEKTEEAEETTTETTSTTESTSVSSELTQEAKEAKENAKDVNFDPNEDLNFRLITSKATTTENIQQVRDWFAKNLPNMPLEVVNNLINTVKGDAWGVFTGHAVKIYKMAELGTGFHEAFHVVSRLGLTKKQRSRFYDTVRSELNTPSLSDNECEELLAEDFRNWMLTGKSDYYTPNKKKVGFFQKIWDFIKSIVDNFTGKDNINNVVELYNKINTSGFSHIQTSTTKIAKEDWLPRLTGLDETMTEDLRSGTAVYVMGILHKLYDGDFVKFGENIDKVLEDAYNVLLKNADIPAVVTNAMVANKVEFKKSLREYFNYIGLSLEEEGDTRENGGGQNQYQESVYFSNLRNTSNEVKLLIATLPMVDKNGEEVKNSVGLPKIIDFAVAYNKLLETLSGTVEWGSDPNDKFYKVSVMGKLEALAKEFPEYTRLVNRLKMLKGASKIMMQNAFSQAMTINRYGYMTYLIDHNDSRFIESNQSRVIDRLREQVDAAYKDSMLYTKARVGNAQAVNQYIIDLSLQMNKREEYNRLMRELGFDKVLDTNLLFKTGMHLELGVAIRDMFGQAVNGKFVGRPYFIFSVSDEKMGRFKKVLELQAKHTQERFEPQHVNPEGKSVYEYSLNNYYSFVTNVINNASRLNNYADRMEYVDKYLPHFKLIKDTSIWAREIDGQLKSNEPLNLSVTYFEGMDDATSHKEGAVSYDLSPTELMVMHVEAALLAKDPVTVLRRPSDKSLEPGIRGFDAFPIMETNVKNQLIKYLEYDYLTSGSNYNIFSAILSPDTLTKIKALEGKPVGIYKEEIYRDFKNYIKAQAVELEGLASDLKITKKAFSKATQNRGELSKILEDFTLQYVTSRIEQHQLFLGDFTQFGQLFKRTSGPTGTGKSFNNSVESNEAIRKDALEILDDTDNLTDRLDLLLTLSLPELQKLGINVIDAAALTEHSSNVAVLQDPKMTIDDLAQKLRAGYEKVIRDSLTHISNEAEKEARVKVYMKAYNEMDVADGLGFITMEKYRAWFIKSGDWDWNKQEPAYKKVVRGQKLTPEELAMFPVIKPQGFGPRSYVTKFDNKNPTRYAHSKPSMFFAKLSLAPLIPQAIKGTEMENLMKSMRRSGSTIAIHESGLKNKFERSFPINKFEGEEMYLNSFNASDDFWKIQVDIHAELEEADIDGTQQRKLLWLDLFDSKNPVDYKGSDWNKLTYEDKKKASKLYRAYEEYKEVYKNLIEAEKAKFLKELTISKTTATGSEYVISNYEKFAAEIKKEIAARRLPSNVLDAIIVKNNKLVFPIDALTIADKIENLLYARAIKSTIRLKRPGAAYVQTSNAYYRTTGAYLSKTNLTAEQQAKAEMFAKELKFIEPIFNTEGKLTGVAAAEVYLPNYMRGIIPDGADLSKLDPKLLKLMGYRIPTQGQNSMLPLIVKGFLPSEMGDTVIVPYAIVAQSGSDFDIDKLHIFRPNFKPTFNKQSEKAWLNVIKDINTTLSENNLMDFRFKENAEGVEELADMISYLDTQETLSASEQIVYNHIKSVNLEMGTPKYIEGKISGTTKEMQNKLLELQTEVLTSPYVARNMIVPNGAPFLKEEAAFTKYLQNFYREVATIKQQLINYPTLTDEQVVEIFKDNAVISKYLNPSIVKAIRETSDIKPEKNSIFNQWSKVYETSLKNDGYSNLLSYKYELETGMAFKGGKKGVGIVANYSTFHAICQQAGAKIATTRGVATRKVTNGKLMESYIQTPIKFNFNHTGRLGSVKDVKGELISEQFSEHLTANVDIAKDPFIFYLNTNTFTSNIKYMMIAMGAGGEFANRFLTQPIILEYVTERLKNESIIVESTRSSKEDSLYESDDMILRRLAAKYGLSTKDDIMAVLATKHNNGNILTVEALNASMSEPTDPNKLRAFNNTQIQVLADFVEYISIAKDFSNIVSAVKPDTTKVKNNSDATAIIDNIAEVRRVKLISEEDLNNLYSETLLAGFSENHASLYKSLYKSLFVTETENVQKFIYDVIKNDVRIGNSRLTDKEVDKIRQFFMTYLLQASLNNGKPFTKQQLLDARVGNKSVAKSLYTLLLNKDNAENNKALSILFSKLADSADGVDLIKTSNKKIDPIMSNLITEGFVNLHRTQPDLYRRLLEVTAMQTGFSYSPINFLKYFDSTELSSIFAPIIRQAADNLHSVMNVDEFLDLFYNINRRNAKFVPFVRINRGVTIDTGGNVLTLPSTHRSYGRKFVRSTVKKSSEVKGKDKVTTYDVLYKLTGFDSNGAVYIKTNVKGGNFSMELHNEWESFDPDIKIAENTISKETHAKVVAASKVMPVDTLQGVLSAKEEAEANNREYTEFEMITSWESIKDKWLTKYTKADWDNMNQEEREVVIKKCL